MLPDAIDKLITGAEAADAITIAARSVGVPEARRLAGLLRRWDSLSRQQRDSILVLLDARGRDHS